MLKRMESQSPAIHGQGLESVVFCRSPLPIQKTIIDKELEGGEE
jgi:hypothetical protein